MSWCGSRRPSPSPSWCCSAGGPCSWWSGRRPRSARPSSGWPSCAVSRHGRPAGSGWRRSSCCCWWPRRSARSRATWPSAARPTGCSPRAREVVFTLAGAAHRPRSPSAGGLVTAALASRQVFRRPVSELLRRVPPRRAGRAAGLVDGVVVVLAIAGVVQLVSDRGGRPSPVALLAPGMVAVAGGLLAARILVRVARRRTDRCRWNAAARPAVAGWAGVARRPGTARIASVLAVATCLLLVGVAGVDRRRAQPGRAVRRRDRRRGGAAGAGTELAGRCWTRSVPPTRPVRYAMAAVQLSSDNQATQLLAVDASRADQVLQWGAPDAGPSHRVSETLHPHAARAAAAAAGPARGDGRPAAGAVPVPAAPHRPAGRGRALGADRPGRAPARPAHVRRSAAARLRSRVLPAGRRGRRPPRCRHRQRERHLPARVHRPGAGGIGCGGAGGPVVPGAGGLAAERAHRRRPGDPAAPRAVAAGRAARTRRTVRRDRPRRLAGAAAGDRGSRRGRPGGQRGRRAARRDHRPRRHVRCGSWSTDAQPYLPRLGQERRHSSTSGWRCGCPTTSTLGDREVWLSRDDPADETACCGPGWPRRTSTSSRARPAAGWPACTPVTAPCWRCGCCWSAARPRSSWPSGRCSWRRTSGADSVPTRSRRCASSACVVARCARCCCARTSARSSSRSRAARVAALVATWVVLPALPQFDDPSDFVPVRYAPDAASAWAAVGGLGLLLVAVGLAVAALQLRSGRPDRLREGVRCRAGIPVSAARPGAHLPAGGQRRRRAVRRRPRRRRRRGGRPARAVRVGQVDAAQPVRRAAAPERRPADRRSTRDRPDGRARPGPDAGRRRRRGAAGSDAQPAPLRHPDRQRAVRPARRAQAGPGQRRRDGRRPAARARRGARAGRAWATTRTPR